MTEELECICCNCSSFFPDRSDFENGFGVCLRDNDEFDPYIEEVLENVDFSCCIELYCQKRFNGDRKACPEFEETEIIEIEDSDTDDYMDDQKASAIIEYLRTRNVEEFVKMLYCSNEEEKGKALYQISTCINFGNREAFDSLLKYYMALPQVVSIGDVHFRLKVLKTLISSEYRNDLVDVLIDELYMMPSNNTTRQLYSEILRFLNNCSNDIVKNKLRWLLKKKKFSNKMYSKILSIIYK